MAREKSWNRSKLRKTLKNLRPLLLIPLLAVLSCLAPPVFADGIIPILSIELPNPEIERLRQQPRRYVRATLREGTKVYRNVGLHLKGSTGSFRPIDEKPSFTLDFTRFSTNETFHSFTKIHLNNSVEDPAYVNEVIGSELFRAAGIPAPQVTRSVVELNGKRLGLYVLKEGFDDTFLEAHFHNRSGALYEPLPGSDIDGQFEQRAGGGGDQALAALRSAMAQQDQSKKWLFLRKSIDLDSFVTFMALEVMICHRDGYCLARNNFRIYRSPDNEKFSFIPDGMDQLFGIADLPWDSHFGGLAARAVADNPEVFRAYRNRLAELVSNLFLVDKLTNRVNALVGELKPVARPSEFKEIQAEADRVCERIIVRYARLRLQLTKPESFPLQFNQGSSNLAEWYPTDRATTLLMDEPVTADGFRALHIVAGKTTSASWRTKVVLNKGAYRFEALAKLSGVVPKSFGQNQGAGLRIVNQSNPAYHFVGDSNWKELKIGFTVDTDGHEVELACELRADAGEAWFQIDALRLIKLE